MASTENMSSKVTEVASGKKSPITTPTLKLPYKPNPTKTPGQKANFELALVAMNNIEFKGKSKNHFAPGSPLDNSRRGFPIETSPLQLTREEWPLSSTSKSEAASADSGIPTIQVKHVDIGSVQEAAGGSVLPASHIQSPRHLCVNDRVRDKTAKNRGVTLERETQGFWQVVDRILGLRRVRSFGEDGGHKRLAAKRAVYRAILTFGVLMVLNLITSAVLFVVVGSNGTKTNPAWFVWMGISGLGLIWSILAFIMATRQKKQAQFEEEISRQRGVIWRILRDGDIEMNVVSSPGNNEQQVHRDAAAVAASLATSVGAPQG